METLGQRNKNPLNIRFNRSNKWVGQIGVCSGFCVFDSFDYGFRAAMLLVARYIRFYNLNSVRKIIYRFAPPFENKTESYIEFCTKQLFCFGFYNSVIVPYSNEFYCLISAMAMFESHIEIDCDSLRKLAKKFNLF